MTDSLTRTHTPTDDPNAPRRVPGEEGLWVFILGDMTIFALLFGAFLLARRDHPAEFASGGTELNIAYGTANTIVLLTSSVLVASAAQAHRAHRAAAATALLLGAIGCGLVFVVLKVFEWSEVLGEHPHPADNPFYTYYFGLTGLHLLHLVLGTGALLLVRRAMRRDAPHRRDRLLIEAGSTYWHMVDLLWIIIFPLVYLVPA
ncbi:cytochrome c oxidase subunit 3 [Nocardia amikacinitolerans]|uniref:cytochrome c oxidase subunit 3 n=1 Tax=Nocardia amikacinitolerans TaxID=756689 RepID=UPI0020A4D2C4|nr:cytochrome c oxidase subunit 3 [Nocardia amikacinitolerans]MCP2281033.1 nitric oxide reductase NorE protein [Nocardia amikacinitolerans]MCP2300056.1 nitric oxide reductase NorE protein [Nocardia amikacinitolerans]